MVPEVSKSPYYRNLAVVLVLTAAIMSFFLVGIQFLFPEVSDQAADLITISSVSVFVVLIVHFPLRSYLDEIERANKEMDRRLNAEAELRKNESKFREIFASANDAIFIHGISDDGPGRFASVNPQASRLLGYTEAELLNMGIPDIDVPEMLPNVQKILRSLHDEGKVIFETEFRTKSGARVPVEISDRLITFDGKPVVLSVVRDITERKQAERALLLSNKKLSLLSSVTRHDILNQLTALGGFIELTKEIAMDPRELEFIARELQIAERIRTQIQFTKDYETLGSKAPVWQNISDVATSATAEILPFPLHKAGEEIEIFADPLLERVFYNLGENAIRYGDHVSEITITCATDPATRTAKVTIEDDGIGVSEDDKEKIFKRGFGKNTGLGLFLSREILALTDIAIRENGEPGKGARFELTVPEGAFRVVEAK